MVAHHVADACQGLEYGETTTVGDLGPVDVVAAGWIAFFGAWAQSRRARWLGAVGRGRSSRRARRRCRSAVCPVPAGRVQDGFDDLVGPGLPWVHVLGILLGLGRVSAGQVGLYLQQSSLNGDGSDAIGAPILDAAPIRGVDKADSGESARPAIVEELCNRNMVIEVIDDALESPSSSECRRSS